MCAVRGGKHPQVIMLFPPPSTPRLSSFPRAFPSFPSLLPSLSYQMSTAENPAVYLAIAHDIRTYHRVSSSHFNWLKLLLNTRQVNASKGTPKRATNGVLESCGFSADYASSSPSLGSHSASSTYASAVDAFVLLMYRSFNIARFLS